MQAKSLSTNLPNPAYPPEKLTNSVPNTETGGDFQPWISSFFQEQALQILNSMLSGVDPTLRQFLKIPKIVFEHPKSRRPACQFLRDMADRLDPEGPLSAREWVKLSDVAEEFVEVCDKYEIGTKDGVALLQKALEERKQTLGDLNDKK